MYFFIFVAIILLNFIAYSYEAYLWTIKELHANGNALKLKNR